MVSIKKQSGIIWIENSLTGLVVQDCACVLAERDLKVSKKIDVDCACASLETYPDLLSPAMSTQWTQAPQMFLDSLDQEFTVAFTHSQGGNAAVLDSQALARLHIYHTPAQLETDTDHILAYLGLIVPKTASTHFVESQPNTLTAWLHLTNLCNLSCPYCYVTHTPTQMSLEVGKEAIRRLFRSAERHKYRRLKIKYAGGEPLLCFDLMREFHNFANQLALSTGIELNEVVLSNGTLFTDERLKWLVDEDIRLMLSLDGVEQFHDCLRFTAEGKGSFAQVAHTIDRALDLGVKCHISTTVSTYNVEGLKDVVNFALDHGLLPHLNLVRSSDPSLLPAEKVLIQNIQETLSELQQRLPFPHSLLDGFFDLAVFSPHHHACGAGEHYIVVGADGGIYACQMMLNQQIGSILDKKDPLQVIHEAHPVPPISPKQHSNCNDCFWQYVCAGGCPLLTQAHIYMPYCNVYRVLLPELVRLEGLRLLSLAN